jgi:hypothetical protein
MHNLMLSTRTINSMEQSPSEADSCSDVEDPSPVTEPEVSLPYLTTAASGSYFEDDYYISYRHTLFL